MEMRERNKGFGVPSSIGNYHPPAPQELPNSQALDHHLLLHQNLDLQQQEVQRVGGRVQNPDPDPAQLVTSATINPPSDSQTTPQPPHPPTAISAAPTTVRYRECLKNHAASMGSHVVDGCGEFMPSGEDGKAEELKCAACDCHRNFHRREIEGEAQPPNNSHYPQNPTRNNTRRNPISSLQSSQPPPPAAGATTQQQPKYHQGFAAFANSPSTGLMPAIMMAFGGTSGAPAESSSEDLNVFHNNAGGQQSKKRFRTKFSQEQKNRMSEFAERIGWKIQKQDEQEVQQFCNANGVKRQVFKVWMHNNKQAMKKKQL